MSETHIFGEHMDEYANETEIAPGVFVEPGESVTIVDESGEVVHWTADEWTEDPDSVTACVNACVLAAMKGPGAVRANIGNGKVLMDLIDETMDKVRPRYK